MKSLPLVSITLISLLGSTSIMQASSVVFADNFDNAPVAPTSLNGRTPDIAASSTTWVEAASNEMITLNPSGTAGVMAINIQSNQSWSTATPLSAPTVATDFSISYDMTLSNNTSGTYWVGVGFDDAADANFTAASEFWLQVWGSDTAQGTNVSLRSGGSTLDSVSNTSGIAAWNQNSLNSINISYTAATDSIDVTINGNLVFDDVLLGGYEPTMTYFKVGASNSYNGANNGIQFDNFVASVPEPAEQSLLFAGFAIALVGLLRRKRTSAHS